MFKRHHHTAAHRAHRAGPIVPRWLLVVLGLLIIVCCVSLLLSKTHPNAMQRLDSQTLEVMAPLHKLLQRPGRVLGQGYDYAAGMLEAYDENLLLRQERDTLLAWQHKARRLETENARLRDMMQVVPRRKQVITAHMRPGLGLAMQGSALLDAGRNQGIGEHMAVLSPAGLVGRIVTVSQRYARILLVTDVNANIPIITEPSGVKAIATGTGSAQSLKLELIDQPEALNIGDILLTSGDGGMLPGGIVVGRVTVMNGDRVVAAPIGLDAPYGLVSVMVDDAQEANSQLERQAVRNDEATP